MGSFSWLSVVFLQRALAYPRFKIHNKRTKRKLDRAGIDYVEVKEEITKAYLEIQRAISQGDVVPVKGYMVEKFFKKQQNKLFKLARSCKRNIRENVELSLVEPVYFSKKKLFEKICFRVEGSRINYVVKTPREQAANRFLNAWSVVWEKVKGCLLENYLSGECEPRLFAEYLTFVRSDQDKWKLRSVQLPPAFDQDIYSRRYA